MYLDFANDDALDTARVRLAASGINLKKISYKTVTNSEFWVLLGPYSTNEAAQQKLADVSAQGFDGLVISSGEFANAISFGVFNDAVSAQAEVDKLQLSAVQANIRRKDQSSDDQWLRISEQSVYDIEANWLVRLKNDFKLTKSEKKSCN